MLLRRTLIPSLGQSLISESEMGLSKHIFEMKQSDGAELECFLQYEFQPRSKDHRDDTRLSWGERPGRGIE